ncbi:hypothetical protein D3C72_2463480 [compost metagenome]
MQKMRADGDGDVLQYRTRFTLALVKKRRQRQGEIVHDVVDLAATASKTGGGGSMRKLADFMKQGPWQMESE